MTQKKKTGISRLLEFGGRYRWMTVVACILSGLSSVLMLCPFLCIWLVLRDVLAALPDLSTVDVAAMTLYGWAALGLAVGGFLLYSLALLFSHLGAFHTAKNMQSQILQHGAYGKLPGAPAPGYDRISRDGCDDAGHAPVL